MDQHLYSFVGGTLGAWRVLEVRRVAGEPVPAVERIDVRPGWIDSTPASARWVLRGAVSHERYVTRSERARLAAVQPSLGRREALHAALIPISPSTS
jgi:hypothetical protein